MTTQLPSLVFSSPADQLALLRGPQPTPSGKLRDIVRMVRRRMMQAIIMVVLLNAVAVWGLLQVTPRYTAEALVMISPREQQVVDVKAVLSGLSGESEVIESEIQVMRSRDTARQVVHQLDLDKLPEFNPLLARPRLLTRLKTELGELIQNWAAQLPEPLRKLLTADSKVSSGTSEAQAAMTADPLYAPIDIFEQHLLVSARGHSRVVSIGFESANSVLSAQVANAVADAYIANQLKAKSVATADAHRWLEDRVTEMRQQVLNADAAVVAYRHTAGLTDGRQGPLLNEQVSQLSEQLIQARGAEADVSSRLQAAQSGGQRAFGLQVAFNAAHDRVRMLEGQLAVLRLQSGAADQSNIELHALEREADADRALYDRLLTRLKETNVEAGLLVPDSQMVSRADAPESPTFPKPALILPVVFVASLIVVGLLVIGLESLDHGFSSLEQVELELGVAGIGAMPAMRRSLSPNRLPERAIVSQPNSQLGESLRNLYTTLILSAVDKPPAVVLVASALPQEGKTSLTLSLARLLSLGGKRVLVIDCDLHRGRLHEICGLLQGPGLMECLQGTEPLSGAIGRDSLSPACIMPTGVTPRAIPDLLGSPEMRALLNTLRQDFDLILLDSAPLLAVSDTRNLCRLADKTVLAVRWRETRSDAVSMAIRLVREAGGNVAGCMLTLVNLKKYAQYGQAGLYLRQAGLYLTGR